MIHSLNHTSEMHYQGIYTLYTKAIASHYLNIVVSVPGRLVDDGRRFTENEFLPFGPNEELID